MLDRIHIINELNTLSPVVAKLPFSPVFTVPEGYFTQFPEKLMQKIKKQGDSEVVSELEEISPLLASLQRKTPFSVPDGYFSDFSSTLYPESEIQTAPVISMVRAKRMKIFYAAAAIAAIVGLSSLFFAMNDHKPTIQDQVNVVAELPKLDVSEMNLYLQSSPEFVQAEPLSLAGLEDIDFEGVINDLNDEELKQFVNENPSLHIENMN